jgi:predicted metalloendopeptidase
MRPRWKRCVDAVAGAPGDDQLGEIVGEIFVRDHFGANAQARVRDLVSALEGSLGREIQSLDWMAPDTRRRALEKLKTLHRKIGGPDKWRDFSSVAIDPSDFVGNTLNVQRDTMRRQLGWTGQKVDRTLWLMTPQTVNAYYARPLNEIVFPAGILQPPYFDAAADDAVNFGAIGAAIGHELSHAFDDQGRRYDSSGNLADWWTADDDRMFRERAACVSRQYDAYPAVGSVKLNGALTLGENIADNAGARIAYYALIETLDGNEPAPVDGFSASQRFFLAWAQLWCENATDEDFRRRAQEDTHSSGRWRANGVLQNFEEFRKAFGCRTGTPMAPANVCRVW